MESAVETPHPGRTSINSTVLLAPETKAALRARAREERRPISHMGKILIEDALGVRAG